MALPIQKFREAVFQLLYSMEFHTSSDDELVAMVMQELKVTKKNANEALDKAKKVAAAKETIDALLAAQVEDYSLDRIHSVERNVIRLALYEAVIEKTLPLEVAIAEGKRLVKKFSTNEAESFVQAIIDGVYKKEVGKEMKE